MSTAPGATDPSAGISFVMELGAALHKFGTPAHRLEGAMSAMARELRLEAHILSTPTSIMAGFGPLHDQRHVLVRVDPGEINLEKLAALNQVADEVIRGEVALADGLHHVREIAARGPRYRAPLIVLGLGALSGSAAVFFAGGLHDVAVSALIGLVIGVLALAFRFVPAGSRVFELVAAACAAAMAHGAFALELPVSIRTCILAGVIALLPGYTLTVAMTEVATRNLVSGTARLTAAAVAFLQIIFGVALAEIVMHRLVGRPDAADVVATPLPAWADIAALAVFIPAAMVELGAHPRHILAIAIGCVSAYYSSSFGADLLTPELGAAIGGFALAAGSNIYARVFRRPAMVPLVPGLLLLVPGSMGLRSLSAMLERDVVSGIDTAFAMILVAVSLVAGLLVANASIPPRREL